MKIGLLSDIHGNHIAMEAVMEFLLPEVDTFAFLGDLCGYYPFLSECLDLYPRDNVVGVLGNHDSVLIDCYKKQIVPSNHYEDKYGSAISKSLLTVTDDKLEPLLELPLTFSSNWCGVEIAMYHGAPWDFLQGRIYPDYQNWERFADVPADIILLGHTHYPLVKYVHGKQIITPGSAGQARNCSGLPCCAILDLRTTSVSLHNIPYPTKSIIESAKVNDPNIKYLVEVLER